MLPADLAWRLLLAAGLGAAVGLEREYRQKPAGLRTNILISLGSALFTILSTQMGHESGTADRIAAQIVTGIGFLGGGRGFPSRTRPASRTSTRTTALGLDESDLGADIRAVAIATRYSASRCRRDEDS